MNYPIWDIPSPGLLIAFVAVVHVFISHFAVGGGLFLVLAERKARAEGDATLLSYVRAHTRFFVLLTLVFGAMTGVGIWFTIALVHPSAVASLIAGFVWAWAIEWTFFVVEIAAALVYYYGWDRLRPEAHLRIGWVYFGSAWLSLAVINGILSFMMTPGTWITTRSFWDGILNPTYVSSVVLRTFGAVGLAGLYALLTTTWLADKQAKSRIARYAATRWVLPAAIGLPLAVLWYLSAAASANVPVAEILGASGTSPAAILRTISVGVSSGHPMAHRALIALVFSSVLIVLLTTALVSGLSSRYNAAYAAVMMVAAFVALGSSEWIREDLRKPYVIGDYMFVNGIRLGAPPGVTGPPAGLALAEDRFAIDAVRSRGILQSALWTRAIGTDGDETLVAIERGGEVFRIACSTCHTTDGYLAIRPLVNGLSASAIAGVIDRLAHPTDADAQSTNWLVPHLRLATWRNRRMPPFAGTAEERDALAAYLATLGGATPAEIAQAGAEATLGAKTFDEKCSPCHGPDAAVPFNPKGRQASEFYDLIGRLPQVRDVMPPFEGTDEERRALSEFLPTLEAGRPKGGAQ